jgi:hypothetical protein
MTPCPKRNRVRAWWRCNPRFSTRSRPDFDHPAKREGEQAFIDELRWHHNSDKTNCQPRIQPAAANVRYGTHFGYQALAILMQKARQKAGPCS